MLNSYVSARNYKGNSNLSVGVGLDDMNALLLFSSEIFPVSYKKGRELCVFGYMCVCGLMDFNVRNPVSC